MIKQLILKHMANKQAKMAIQHEIDKLADELAVKIIYQESRINGKDDKVFIRHTGYELNPKYISKKDYADIIALSVFLRRKHASGEAISQDQLDKIIEKGHEFAFLRKVNKVVPNMVEEILDHGPSYAGAQYANYIKFKEDLRSRKI